MLRTRGFRSASDNDLESRTGLSSLYAGRQIQEASFR
jgi:hypothetical protein